jgi:hypothetical protein
MSLVRTEVLPTSKRVSDYLIGVAPCVTAETLAICRILLGISLLYFWLQGSSSSFSSLAHNGPHLALTEAIGGPTPLVSLSASLFFREGLYWVIAVLAALLTVGWQTRLVMPLLTAALWLGALLANQGHFIMPLLFGMTAAALAPWGAVWSLDSLHSPAKSTEASPYYGYAIWLIGLSIGLAYAAAGISKLLLTHGAWLWGTGARNGFIQDLAISVSDVGILLSNSYALSFIASAMSAFGQILYLYSSFTRSPMIKYAICFLIAIPFLIGLIVFMGHFWWPWAIPILILYLPWETIDRKIVGKAVPRKHDFPDTTLGQRQRSWFLAATGGLIGLHVVAVATGKEFEPIYTNYPMYIKDEAMAAGSVAETRLWQQWTTAGRNSRPVVHLILNDGEERDLTWAFRWGEFVTNRRIYPSIYARLHARKMPVYASKQKRVWGRLCEDIRAAAQRISSGTARSIRYNVRYYDLVDGKMFWRTIDPTSAIILDLATCDYHRAASSESPPFSQP